MDKGLFAKHINSLLTRSNTKQEIISLLLEKTGIHIEDSEISLSKKVVSLSTSSVKKTALLQKGCKDVLQGLGYTLTI
jgi:hypothetical protein